MAAKNNFVTKQYLDKKLGKFKTELKSELRSELSEDLYKIKDEIVGAMKAMHEESDVHQYSHVRINEELEDHEKRITQIQAAGV